MICPPKGYFIPYSTVSIKYTSILHSYDIVYYNLMHETEASPYVSPGQTRYRVHRVWVQDNPRRCFTRK